MAKAPSRSSRTPARTTLNGRMLAGVLKSLGADPAYRKEFERWHPQERQKVAALVREHCDDSPVPLVATVVGLRQAFLDHGRRLEPVRAEDRPKLQAWLAGPAGGRRTTGQTVVDRLVNDVVREWIQQDNAVVSWMEHSRQPYLLLPEDADYHNRGGAEKLFWRHGLGTSEVDALVKAVMGTAEDKRKVRQRYEKELLEIENAEWNDRFPDLADYYAVATRQRWGAGLAGPRLGGLVLALEQYRSMELGEASYAWAGRRVSRQHKAGYGIKSGEAAGAAFAQAPGDWAKKVKEQHVGKQGFYEYASNWDQEQLLHWLDIKNFAGEKWLTVVERALHWAGPLGSILLGKGQQLGDLWQLFAAEIQQDRAQLAGLLAEVIGEFAGVPVSLVWGDECFVNPRLFAELLKQGHASGAVSNRTLVQHLGKSLDDELARKKLELQLERETPGVLKPIYDAAHGEDAAAGSGGRPPGSPDPGGQ